MRLRNGTAEPIQMILHNEVGFVFFRTSLPAQGVAVFTRFSELEAAGDDPVVVRIVTGTDGSALSSLTGGGDPTENNDGNDNVAASALVVRNSTDQLLRFRVEVGSGQDFNLLPGQVNGSPRTAEIEVRRDADGIILSSRESVPFGP